MSPTFPSSSRRRLVLSAMGTTALLATPAIVAGATSTFSKNGTFD